MTTKRLILIAVALSAFCAPQMYADKNDTLAEKNYAAKQEMPTYVKTFQAGTISDLEDKRLRSQVEQENTFCVHHIQ